MHRAVSAEPVMSAAEMLAGFMNTAVAFHIALWNSEGEALVGHFKLPALMFRSFEILSCITIALQRESLRMFDD